jgi:hypothetical protein
MRRNLIYCGIVAGPLFIAVTLIQAFTRTGFDLARHPLSLLSLGSLGWIQILNFVVSGICTYSVPLDSEQAYDRVAAAPGVHCLSDSAASD